jgi:hypothetical protein
MGSVEDILRDRAVPAPLAAVSTPSSEKGLSPPKANLGRSISPFRRLANKMGGGGSRTPPSVPNLSAGAAARSNGGRGDESPSAAAASRRLKSSASSADLLGQARRQSTKPPAAPLTHKHSRSTVLSGPDASLLLSGTYSPYQRDPAAGTDSNHYLGTPSRPSSRLRPSFTGSVRDSNRLHEPGGGGSGSKPVWNISTRRNPKDDRALPRVSGRRSTLGFASSVGSVSGRETPSSMVRPGSPALSAVSGRTDTSSVIRPRPMSPSRIPAPTYHFRSATPFQGFPDDASSSEGGTPTTILQRTTIPTPPDSLSNWSQSQSQSVAGTPGRPPQPPLIFSSEEPGSPTEELLDNGNVSSSRSRFFRHRSVTPSPHYSPPPPPALTLSSLRNAMQTPEPALQARAQRLASLYRSRSPSSRPTKQQSTAAATPNGGGGGGGGRNRSNVVSPTLLDPADKKSSSASAAGGQGPSSSSGGRAYVANPIDVLDTELVRVVNALPLPVHVERIDKPVTKTEAKSIKPQDWIARYSLDGVQVMCKVIDRAAKGRKVMVRADGRECSPLRFPPPVVLSRDFRTDFPLCIGWQDLDLYLLNRQARAFAASPV